MRIFLRGGQGAIRLLKHNVENNMLTGSNLRLCLSFIIGRRLIISDLPLRLLPIQNIQSLCD